MTNAYTGLGPVHPNLLLEQDPVPPQPQAGVDAT